MDTLSDFVFVIPAQSLKAAFLVSLLSVWVLIGIFFYLNHYTRRRYFTIWATAWLFYAIWLTLGYYLQDLRETDYLLLFRQWCICATASLLLWGSVRFLGQHAHQKLIGLFILFLFTYSYYGAFYLDDYYQIRLPIYILICLASLRVSLCFIYYRKKHPFIGAGLLAFGFFLYGIFHFLFPFMQRSPELYSASFLMSAVIQLFISVSMIVLVLEESRITKKKVITQVFEYDNETKFLKKTVSFTEERYRLLFEQASEPIIIVNVKDLKILDLNRTARRLLDVASVEEARNYQLQGFLCLDDKQMNQLKNGEDWLKCLTEQKPLFLRQKNGTIVAVELDGSIINVNGNQALQLFIRELTERAKLEQQLRQAEKLSALGQLVSGIAHELNNPLSVIKGYVEVILKHHNLTPETRSDLERVEKECVRAVNLVKNFLTFAKERALRREPVNVNDIIMQVMELRKFTTKIANVNVVYEFNPHLPITMADPEQIQQVIVVLINNAIQSMEKTASVRCLILRTDTFDKTIKIEVQDNGPGVPPHLEGKIFEPFFTTKEVGTGTGLGLSIAHSIISEHNGRIYHIRPKEGGACFIVELPIVEPEIPVLTKEGKSLETQFASFPAKVLVVDDEPAVAEMLGEILRLIGYVPTMCNSAFDALALLSQNKFDVIVSDIRMPGMDGKQFYKRLKVQQPDYIKRIIFLTGDTVSEDTKEFLVSTGNLHLSKPFQIATVQEAIEKVIAQVPPPEDK